MRGWGFIQGRRKMPTTPIRTISTKIYIFCVGKLMRTARGTEMEDEAREKKSQRFKWQAKQNETKFKYENSFDKLLPLYMNFPFVF